MEKLAYSVEEAMEVLGIGKNLIFDEIRTGNLKSAKVGKRRLIPVWAAKEWLENKVAQTMGEVS